MPDPVSVPAKAADALTDGTGVSPLNAKKLLKDAVLDFLLSVPAALIVVNIASIPLDEQGWITAGIALGNVAVKVVYRALLRWAQSE
jgi:hypothetical protein